MAPNDTAPEPRPENTEVKMTILTFFHKILSI